MSLSYVIIFNLNVMEKNLHVIYVMSKGGWGGGGGEEEEKTGDEEDEDVKMMD